MVYLEYIGWNETATGGFPGRIWFILNIQVGIILEGILGRTMEQSILEVLQEEETALLR